ncbi:uncharacterized protein LOC127716271 [Mytilus californianus]|uniref:uncharacterized protein LOC127716271 n=1 Tax=Mytilus californianus TaxID=6549 RepID=UPI00224855B3|nr:uncharacterized protein LOC127716271 [Mytilus californianus]
MCHIASIFVFIIIRQTSCIKDDGTCIRKEELGGKHYVNLTVCCDNYEQDNNKCIECAVGYTSKSGFPCEQCSMKTYGTKCLDQCECTVEKCDHVRGCTSESPSNESISVNITMESTVWLQTSWPRTVTDTYGYSSGLLVYVICAGCVTFVITLTGIVMIHKRKRKRSYLTVHHQVNNSTNQQTQDLSDEQYTTIL